MEGLQLEGDALKIEKVMIDRFGKTSLPSPPKILQKTHPEKKAGVTWIETEEVKGMVGGVPEKELVLPEVLPFNLKVHQTLLLKLLKRVQEYGVKADLHFKKPYLYTGSWMESIRTIEDLIASVEAVPQTEAAMKIFNVL